MESLTGRKESNMNRYGIMSFCNRNGVYIYPVPVKDSEGAKRPKVHLVLKLPQKKPITAKETYHQNGQLTQIILNKYKDIYEYQSKLHEGQRGR